MFIRKVMVLSVMLCALLLAPFAAARADAATTVPLSGAFTDPTGLVGSYRGTFTIQRFAQQDGKLVAVGTVTASLFDTAGNLIRTVTKSGVSLPATVSGGTAAVAIGATADSGPSAAQTASCAILHLELGPLDLDLLGLVIHLDRVVLDITAQQGSGNLLGNLLCAITGLLDSGAPLSQVVQLLNQMLALLG